MKKITFAFFGLFVIQLGFSQSDCNTALSITPGITSVANLTGTAPINICDGDDPATAGAWYAFTPATGGTILVSSDLAANAGGDTNLMVYSGTCDALICEAFEDDVDLEGDNYLSSVVLAVSVGVTYYIAWDNRWADDAFTFELEFNSVTCQDTAPYAQNFNDNTEFIFCYTTEDVDGDGLSWISQQDLDLNGDGTNETFATNANSETGPKNDWLFSPGFTLTAGTAYQVISRFNVLSPLGTANGSLEAFMTNAPSSTAATQIPLFSQTDITAQGAFETLEAMAYEETNSFTPATSGTFYIAYRSFGAGGSGFVLLFDSNIDFSLGVVQKDTKTFKHFYNNVSDVLTLTSSNRAFDFIQIYNIMGQEVLKNTLSQTTEDLNLSGIQDGIYFANVWIAGRVKTIKFLKQ